MPLPLPRKRVCSPPSSVLPRLPQMPEEDKAAFRFIGRRFGHGQSENVAEAVTSLSPNYQLSKCRSILPPSRVHELDEPVAAIGRESDNERSLQALLEP